MHWFLATAHASEHAPLCTHSCTRGAPGCLSAGLQTLPPRALWTGAPFGSGSAWVVSEHAGCQRLCGMPLRRARHPDRPELRTAQTRVAAPGFDPTLETRRRTSTHACVPVGVGDVGCDAAGVSRAVSVRTGVCLRLHLPLLALALLTSGPADPVLGTHRKK